MKLKLQHIVRYAPVVTILFGAICAQCTVWMLHGFHLQLAALIILLILCWRAVYRRSRFAVGGVLGIISALLSIWQSTAPDSYVISDGAVLVKVVEPPRRPQPGKITFIGKNQLNNASPLLFITAIDLPWRAVSDLQDGDTHWVRGKCAPIPSSWNPFSFDARHFREGVGYSCKARFISERVSRSTTLADNLRRELLNQTRSVIGDSEGLGIFFAMTLGYRDLLSVETEREFKRTGLAHLLVVSGYQVTLVFTLLVSISGYVFRMLAGNFQLWSLRKISAIPAILASFVYIMVCGFESSTVRAFAAACCFAVHRFDEHAARFSGRCGAALLLLTVLNPFSFFDLGVQLTFAALFGIGVGMSIVSGIKVTPPSAILSFITVTFTVWIFTSFILIIWIGEISLISCLMNSLLAAAWSIINCSVGLIGLFFLALGVDSSGVILGSISLLNSLAVQFVSYSASFGVASLKLEGVWQRGGGIIVLGGVATALCYAGWKRQLRMRLGSLQ